MDNKRRPIDHDDSGSDTDEGDFGPSILAAEPIKKPSIDSENKKPRLSNKPKNTNNSSNNSSNGSIMGLDNLPIGPKYEWSYLHGRGTEIVRCLSLSQSGFVVTLAGDGCVRFWRRSSQSDGNGEGGFLVLISHFAHRPISQEEQELNEDTEKSDSGPSRYILSATADEKMCCSIVRGTVHIFDVLNVDMISTFSLPFRNASTACWIASHTICIADSQSAVVGMFDPLTGQLRRKIEGKNAVHSAPVRAMQYTPLANCLVSVDEKGMIEYWTHHQPYDMPTCPAIKWQFKSQTHLYDLAKCKSTADFLRFSPDWKRFLTYSSKEGCIRIFDFGTGMLVRRFDVGLEDIKKHRISGLAPVNVADFDRRLILENELMAAKDAPLTECNVIFDESGAMILYPTLYGIEVRDIRSGKVVAVMGSDETLRFTNVSLYTGAPSKKNLTLEMAASDNPALRKRMASDPMVVCTAFQSRRFYLFTKRLPAADRDVMNEPDIDPLESSSMNTGKSSCASRELDSKLAQRVILRTSVGDIIIRLFPQRAPKAVENFAKHCKNGYYDKVRFHRVIKGFMIQTGDPLGDGTGGESVWGRPFEDECHDDLRHSKPFMVSMANSGPTTNGSQFFITTVPTVSIFIIIFTVAVQ